MLVFTRGLRSAAFVAIGALTLALAQSPDAQGCHGGGMGQSYGMMGGYSGLGPNNTGLPNYSSPVVGSTIASVNNPATVLAHEFDLNLSSSQVQRLAKMLVSGKQRATLVLTKVQKTRLAAILGLVR